MAVIIAARVADELVIPIGDIPPIGFRASGRRGSPFPEDRE
jgi:hypothetical protein